MFRNYFRVALRSLLRYKLFSFINVFGLAVSMSTCLLIFLVIAEQTNYDDFHSRRNSIYRILTKNETSIIPFATSPLPLAEALSSEYQAVEQFVAINSSFVGGDVVHGENAVSLAGRYVSSNFFDAFDFELERGNSATALSQPFSIVFTSEAAKKLFGDEDPVGKVVNFKDRGLNKMGIDMEIPEADLGDFVVTGVLKETTEKSHIQFDVLLSLNTLKALNKSPYSETSNWENYYDYYIYVVLRDGHSVSEVEKGISSLVKRELRSLRRSKLSFELQPLTSITPGRFVNSPISLTMPREGIYFLLGMALVLLLLACFNYANLSVARSLNRGKEIGIRKVLGAHKRHIFLQFIFESITISVISLLFSVLLLLILKPAFTGLWFNKFLSMELSASPFIYFFFLLFSILAGLIGGLYPALYLSSMRPLQSMKSVFNTSASKGGIGVLKGFNIRKALIVTQFIFSLLFITTALIILMQFRHLINADYGFDKSNIIVLKLQNKPYQILRNEIMQSADIAQMAACSFVPATGVSDQTVLKEPINPLDSIAAYSLSVDSEFVPTLKLQLLAGSNFGEGQTESDHERFVILNEGAARKLGYFNYTEIIGEAFTLDNNKDPVQVIGVVRDFYFELLVETSINAPLVLRNLPSEFKYTLIKVQSGKNEEGLAFLKQKWAAIGADRSISYTYYEDQLRATHAIFSDLASITGFISFLAISIACLGLLGMVIFNIQIKKKEIGIRKVIGAEQRNIIYFFSKEYLKMLLVAAICGLPLSYLINSLWLEDFAYRITLRWWMFGLGVLIVFLLALITIGMQIYKASRLNPVDLIKNE